MAVSHKNNTFFLCVLIVFGLIVQGIAFSVNVIEETKNPVNPFFYPV